MRLGNIMKQEFVNVINKLGASELSFKTSYKLQKMMKKFVEEQKLYEASKQKIIEKYGARTEDGKLDIIDGKVNLIHEHKEDWLNQLNELNSIEIDHVYFTLDELEHAKLTPIEVATIEGIIQAT